jgi:hypothetical protein
MMGHSYRSNNRTDAEHAREGDRRKGEGDRKKGEGDRKKGEGALYSGWKERGMA